MHGTIPVIGRADISAQLALLRRKLPDSMTDVKTLVDTKIAGKKVMVFSKSYCPYCKKAKDTLKKYVGNELAQEDYEVMEIEDNPSCGEIQDYLLNITGGRSVPRVFVNGKFIGGGDETTQLHREGKLKALLAA